MTVIATSCLQGDVDPDTLSHQVKQALQVYVAMATEVRVEPGKDCSSGGCGRPECESCRILIGWGQPFQFAKAVLEHQQATGELSGPAFRRKGHQTGYLIIPAAQMTEDLMRKRSDDYQCQLKEQSLSTKFNDATRDYKREVDTAKENKWEKPKRAKKAEDITLFGAAYVPLGFHRPPRPPLIYWLNEFCHPDSPFDCANRMTLWWQSAGRGDALDMKKETSMQTPSRHASSATWTHCFCGFAVPAGSRPPAQWYNTLPGVASVSSHDAPTPRKRP